MGWFFALFLIGILAIVVLYSYLYGITPTPTSPKVKKQLFSMLPIITHCEIAELGSGWGTLAFPLARHYPLCKVKAYEISPFPYFVSKIIADELSLPNLSIQRQDFFQISLKNTSLVVCYLYPEAMQRLKAKFETELAPGSYVLTHTFAVPGWTPVRVERAHDLYNTPIYLYQIQKV